MIIRIAACGVKLHDRPQIPVRISNAEFLRADLVQPRGKDHSVKQGAGFFDAEDRLTVIVRGDPAVVVEGFLVAAGRRIAPVAHRFIDADVAAVIVGGLTDHDSLQFAGVAYGILAVVVKVAAEGNLPILPVFPALAVIVRDVVPVEGKMGIDRMLTSLLRDLHRGVERFPLRQTGVAGDRSILRTADQSVAALPDPSGHVLAVAAGQQRSKVLAGAVGLLFGRLTDDRHGDAFRRQLAELLRAAAPELGQDQLKGLFRIVIRGDQFDGDLDLVDGTGERQVAFLLCVVHAGLGGTVHGGIMDRDVVALAAGTDDLDAGGVVGTGDRDLLRGEAELGGLALVIIGDHERQGVAHIAELAAFAGRDGEQAQLRQLCELVVPGCDADVLHGFAVGKGEVKPVDGVVLVEDQLGVAGLLLDLQILGKCGGRGDGLKGFPHDGFRAGQHAAVPKDAAEVQPAPGPGLIVPEIAPAQRQLRLVRVANVLPGAVLLHLPAVAFGRLGDRQLQLVLALHVLRDLRDDDRGSCGGHLPLRHGDAQLLIDCKRVRILVFDPKVLLAGRGVIVNRAFAVRLGCNCRGVGDLCGDSAHGAAQAVYRDQNGLRDLFPVLRL